MTTAKVNFNDFCVKFCDRLYTPNIPFEDQSTGYKKLYYMVKHKIKPASKDEITRYRTNPTYEELLSKPDDKYLLFLHPILRDYVIDNWSYIEEMELV